MKKAPSAPTPRLRHASEYTGKIALVWGENGMKWKCARFPKVPEKYGKRVQKTIRRGSSSQSSNRDRIKKSHMHYVFEESTRILRTKWRGWPYQSKMPPRSEKAALLTVLPNSDSESLDKCGVWLQRSARFWRKRRKFENTRLHNMKMKWK